MSGHDTINRIRGALGDHVLAVHEPSARRAWIDIAPETVSEATTVMLEEVGARLQIATGIDTPAGIEVMYHWALDGEDCLVTVRATVSHEDPVLESIAPICPAAEWIEREIWELLGVRFSGHPDLRHLLLDDSWPEGSFPLRKDHRRQGRLPQGVAEEASTVGAAPVGAGHAGDSPPDQGVV